MRSVFENRLNVLLSELLNEIGIFSHSEYMGKGGREDIIAYHQGLRIALEGSYSKSDAEKDATKRIDQFPIDLALAIYYVEKYSQDLSELELKKKLRNSNFYVKVIVPVDISETIFEYLYEKEFLLESKSNWIKVNIVSLANLIKESAQFIISEKNVEEIESEVEIFINDFINLLKTHPKSNNIAKNFYRIFFELYGFSIGSIEDVKEIIFAQAGLALLLSTIYYESIRYKYSFQSIRISMKDSGIISALQVAIEDILEINYEPIFKITREILKSLPPRDNRVYKNLLELSIKIASKHSLLRKDLAGKIYHRIIGEQNLRKGLATYYTQIPSAYLLLYLTKMSPKVDLNSINNNKIKFKLPLICDFACGSGTLLTAAYSAIRNNFTLKFWKEGIDIDPNELNEMFHKEFMKNCYGIDVLKYATQITALNLAFHNPEIELDQFNTYSLPLGIRSEKEKEIFISLGSLEYAKSITLKSFIGEKATQVGIKGEEEKFFIPKYYDLIVMNPPFTRATGRGGKEGGGLFGFIIEDKIRDKFITEFSKLREEIRQKLINNARNFLNNTDLAYLLESNEYSAFKSIGPAGEGLLFLYLADKWVKNNGKIAFVLPKNLLLASSWFLARVLLLSKYNLEYIVISFDKVNGYNFSESTSLSECLVVAKKSHEFSEEEQIKIIMLLKKPKTSIEAISLVNEIERIQCNDYIEINNCSAFILFINKKLLLKSLNNWGRFIFLPSFNILNNYLAFLNGKIKFANIEKEIPIIKFNEIIMSIGIDRHQFIDNFSIVNQEIPDSVRVLFGGGEQIRTTIFREPNFYAIPNKKGKIIFDEKAGHLLVPERIRLNTAHVMSLYSEIRTLGNMFYSIKLKNENELKLKALCIWFNTTFGILSIIADRQETEGAWINLKLTQWKLIPVLNVNEINDDVLNQLTLIYERFRNIDLGRIPDQYNEKNDTFKLRLDLDMSFLNAFQINVNKEDLKSLYREIYLAFQLWIK
ncbi:MAG: N-6 DNA methylase [Promethearchaeota archaeon]